MGRMREYRRVPKVELSVGTGDTFRPRTNAGSASRRGHAVQEEVGCDAYKTSSAYRSGALILGAAGFPCGRAAGASGIAGVVRDTSGAVLPGVTVEAASPALIEKVRTVVTDGEGRYNIVDLRPGTYVVTFTLPASARSGGKASS